MGPQGKSCRGAAASLNTALSDSSILHDELHSLDIPQRVQYKLAATAHRCLRNQAPTYAYLTAFQCPMLPIAVRQLRSASRHQLTVPRVRCSTFRCRSFSSAGPQSGIHCLTICAIQLLDQTIPRNLKTHLFECC